MKKAIIIVPVALAVILTGTVLLAGAPFSRKVNPASLKAKPITQYSLSTYLEGADCYLDRLDELKADGITNMEICLNDKYDEQAALFANGVKKIQDAGLTVWSIHLPFGFDVSPAALTETQRQKNVQNIKKFIDLTESSGAKTYIIHASFEPVADADRQVMLDSAVKSLAELNAYTAKKGIALALENLPRTCIANSIKEIEYITNSVPDLKLCFDTNHFTNSSPNYTLRPLQRLIPALRNKMNPVSGSPTVFAEKFSDKIATVHISDYDQIDECHWIPGQGTIDFQSIHNSIVTAGFDAPITFEPNEKCKGVKTTGKRLIDGYEKSIGIKK